MGGVGVGLGEPPCPLEGVLGETHRAGGFLTAQVVLFYRVI